MNPGVRLFAYNVRQGGPRDPTVCERILTQLTPDLLFVQESRHPEHSWLPAFRALDVLSGTHEGSWLWEGVSGGRWGSGLWVRDGLVTPLRLPEDFTGRVVAAVIEDRSWPVTGTSPVVALSIHAPTRKGSSYIKEVGRILDFAAAIAEGRPLILARPVRHDTVLANGAPRRTFGPHVALDAPQRLPAVSLRRHIRACGVGFFASKL